MSNGTGESASSLTFLVETSKPAGTCITDGSTRCLQNSRYGVTVDWWVAGSKAVGANVVHVGTKDSTVFTFFDPNNW